MQYKKGSGSPGLLQGSTGMLRRWWRRSPSCTSLTAQIAPAMKVASVSSLRDRMCNTDLVDIDVKCRKAIYRTCAATGYDWFVAAFVATQPTVRVCLGFFAGLGRSCQHAAEHSLHGEMS